MSSRPQRPSANMGELTTPARAFDVLKCASGSNHDVGMEWTTRNGMRTGQLHAYCWTCRAPVAPSTAIHATPADLRERRSEARLTQATRKADAELRRDGIRAALAAGELQSDVAKRLGISKQRVSLLVRGGKVV